MGILELVFPRQIDPPVIAEPLNGASIELEGHQLVPVQVGHTDTDNTTVLHVPDETATAVGLYRAQLGP